MVRSQAKSRPFIALVSVLSALWVVPSYGDDSARAFQLCRDFTVKRLEKMTNDDLYLKTLPVSSKSIVLKPSFLENLIHFTPDGEVDVSGVDYNDSTGDMKIVLNGTGGPGSSFVHIRFGYDTSNSAHRRVNSVQEMIQTPSGNYNLGKVNFEITGNGQSCIPVQVTGAKNDTQFSVQGCQDFGGLIHAFPAMEHCDDFFQGKNRDIECTNLDFIRALGAIAQKDNLPIDSAASVKFFKTSCAENLSKATVAAYSAVHAYVAPPQPAERPDPYSGPAGTAENPIVFIGTPQY